MIKRHLGLTFNKLQQSDKRQQIGAGVGGKGKDAEYFHGKDERLGVRREVQAGDSGQHPEGVEEDAGGAKVWKAPHQQTQEVERGREER